MAPKNKVDILIVGAGPTGLVLALSLLKQGISPSSIRIIDKYAATVSTSRALLTHARTLELYRSFNLTDELLSHGYKVPAVNLWVRGKHQAKMPLSVVGKELTPYPFLFVLAQDRHERILERALNEHGAFVERGVELVDFEDQDSHISAHLLRRNGPNNNNTNGHGTEDNYNEETDTEICETAYLVGCDGAHSAVRHGMKINFEGAPYKQLFYVADIETDSHGQSPVINGEVHLAFKGADFVLFFPYDDKHRCARLIGMLNPGKTDNENNKPAADREYSFDDDVAPRVRNILDLNVVKVNWFSTYRVHHRVADQFRTGRVFLAGDAAHIHSPVGGQGMNTGVGDTINLAWKLASALKGHTTDSTADERLFDSYNIERRAFALQLVHTTDRVFTFATAEGLFADTIRNWIVPTVVPSLFAFQGVREFMFRSVSQTRITYRNSPLAEEPRGTDPVQSGDRLPWVVISSNKQEGRDNNYDTFNAVKWQVHVYGTPTESLRQWCGRKEIELDVFDWDEKYKASGLGRDTVYLLRPDQYIAMIALSGPRAAEEATERLDRYLLEKGLNL
ncbi:FAD binding domain containing protein [Elaphomyces granulatus]